MVRHDVKALGGVGEYEKTDLSARIDDDRAGEHRFGSILERWGID